MPVILDGGWFGGMYWFRVALDGTNTAAMSAYTVWFGSALEALEFLGSLPTC